LRKKEKEKKEKSIASKLGLTTIHTPPTKENDVEIHQMMWWKLDFNHRHQLQTPLESGRAAKACQARVNNLFPYVYKIKNTPMTEQQ
jgi:hypothetical protein